MMNQGRADRKLVGVALAGAGLPLVPPTWAHDEKVDCSQEYQCADEGENLSVRQFSHCFSSSGRMKSPMNSIAKERIIPNVITQSSRWPKANPPMTTMVRTYLKMSSRVLPNSNRRVLCSSI